MLKHSADTGPSFHTALRYNVRFVVLAAFVHISFPVCDCGGISPGRCLVWGPGLNPDAVLPVRYFFIQAVDSRGDNLTSSPGKTTLNQFSCEL